MAGARWLIASPAEVVILSVPLACTACSLTAASTSSSSCSNWWRARNRRAAAFGQADAARGAVQQPRLQMAFSLRHPARYGRDRLVELGGCGGKTAVLHHFAENAHRFEFVHYRLRGCNVLAALIYCAVYLHKLSNIVVFIFYPA